MNNEEYELLAPYQQRVVVEKRELDDRLENLKAFSITETFAKLAEVDRDLLFAQLVHMSALSDVLGKRIDRFVNGPL